MDLAQRLDFFLSKTPQLGKVAFIAPNATLVGDIELADDVSVWYGAILRADIQSIRVGKGSNLQDGVIVHLADDYGVNIGEYCTIGHGAIVHACDVGNECLIGMGATILDGAKLGDGCIVGANSLVPQRFVAPAGSMIYGNPAKVIRPLKLEERGGLREWAAKYVQVAKAHCEQFTKS
jgi:carbonic anhydrase/acetyltransferase-like protein (isoleucine patch superfamily)